VCAVESLLQTAILLRSPRWFNLDASRLFLCVYVTTVFVCVSRLFLCVCHEWFFAGPHLKPESCVCKAMGPFAISQLFGSALIFSNRLNTCVCVCVCVRIANLRAVCAKCKSIRTFASSQLFGLALIFSNHFITCVCVCASLCKFVNAGRVQAEAHNGAQASVLSNVQHMYPV
jgi:hypothetical protein